MASIVTNLERFHSRTVEYLHPVRVVFHHVPKCGGTSVGRALRLRYLLSQETILPEASFRAFAAFSNPPDHEQALVDVLDLREQMLLYLLFQDVRCISAHVRFSNVAYRMFHDRYRFITILRDPVSRFLSHYRWNLRNPADHAHLNVPFEEFLEGPRAQRLGAMYVEYFGGLPIDADIRSEDAIRLAIQNLRNFDVVGRLDRLDEFRAQIKEKLGVRLKIGHENENRSGKLGELSDLAPRMREKLMEICAPDVAVWNSVSG